MGNLKDFLKKFFSSEASENVPSEEVYYMESTDEDFIPPYDFFIEADTRFTDSKTVVTEDIRGIDPIDVLEKMDLADDVKNHWGVRKKLKRLFDDLAFDIGDYVTYEGGRSISGSDYEEIDEHKLEISVDISKNSDSEPFAAMFSINEK